MNTFTAPKPWYREPWPWLLAIMPVTAIVAGSFTAWFAFTTNDGLVVDDYYKQGKAINQSKERDRLAQSLGISAQLQTRGQFIQVQLSGRLQTPPGRLNLKFMHPTRSGDDHDLVLSWNGSAYQGQQPQLNAPSYRLQLTPETGDWRLTGEWETGRALSLTPEFSSVIQSRSAP